MNKSSVLLKRFKAITVFAIIWNVLGVISYFFHVYMPKEAIEKLPEAEQLLYQNIPKWKTITFFLATFGGFVGSILLYAKKKLAIGVLIVSLIGIIISFYYDFFLTNLLEVYGNESVVFPLLVVLIGMFLVWFSKKLDALNQLK